MERNKIIVIIVLSILLLALLTYGIIRRVTHNDEQLAQVNKIFKYSLIAVFIVGVIFLIFYLYNKRKTSSDVIKTHPPDEVLKEIIKRLVFKEGVKGYYDKAGELCIPEGAIRMIDQRPFVSTGSGEEFIAYEIQMIDSNICPNTGTRTLNVPLSRDMKLISGGLYTQHAHTPLFDWVKNKSYLKKLPLTTPQKESLKMAQFAVEQDIDIKNISSLGQEQEQIPYTKESRKKQKKYDNLDYIGNENDENN